MIDLKFIKSNYDCRVEIERDLGKSAGKTAKTLIWLCPFHSEDTPSFHVYANGYFCYGCGKHGDVLDWWMFWTKRDLKSVLLDNHIDLTPEDILQRKVDAANRDIEAAKRKIEEVQAVLNDLRDGGLMEKYHENLDILDGRPRTMWEARGVPIWYQEKISLGFDPDHDFSGYHSPSLTIPIYDFGYELINIRHRLLNPCDKIGKYRPERSGLPQSLFVADPDKPLSDSVFICEGEIKSMVTFCLDPDLQVVGIPGKTPNKEIIRKFDKFSTIYLCLDPEVDPRPLANELCRSRVRIVSLPDKIDDMVVAHQLDRDWLRGIMRSARMA